MAPTNTSLSTAAEAIVIMLAQRGDDGAFEELVRRYQSWMRGLTMRLCGNEALADDLSQQVFLNAWRHMKGLKNAAAFGGWLRRIAISIWLQHLRKHDALFNTTEYDENAPTAPIDPNLAMDLDRALALLPETVRTCLVLSYHENMTHGEIAETCDLPMGTVKSHIQRGAKKLRDYLSAYDKTENQNEL